jgi:hypothetical protein
MYQHNLEARNKLMNENIVQEKNITYIIKWNVLNNDIGIQQSYISYIFQELKCVDHDRVKINTFIQNCFD